jgi:hypothetical protein
LSRGNTGSGPGMAPPCVLAAMTMAPSAAIEKQAARTIRRELDNAATTAKGVPR